MMNKFFKIFLPILAGVLAVAYFVCNLVIPGQTTWFMEQVALVLNYPITIAGVSVTLGAVASYIITKYVMSMTKFGRKELDQIKANNSQYTEQINTFCENVTNEVNDMKAQYEELKVNCNNQITVMLEQFENLQNKTLTALETIPNKKVQAIVAEYKGAYEVTKAEIINKTINTDEYINEKIKKLEEMLNEAKEIFNSETETA